MIKLGRLKDHFFDEINNDDDGYDRYLEDLQILRGEAEYHVLEVFNSLLPLFKGDQPSYYASLPLYKAIWKASTEILPNLEVQVAIDAENNCFVSSGTAGYVDFQIDPVGMILPIKCWIHTHPFGSAYFSGTDISTVSSWEPLMEKAVVIGGIDGDTAHYGVWSQERPKQLEIFNNGGLERIQKWGDEEE